MGSKLKIMPNSAKCTILLNNSLFFSGFFGNIIHSFVKKN